ncbi:MAG: Pseudouridine synthase [Candidatus Amesbacteria bacterium GW2011_GWA1_47_20]|nr:MAG: Pseudouridine synthase [Microgenomates group bacterium GW2011_GWC1_46_20]KKU69805.1 MAG: Pseudouridine synthase [Candidatus Amesbacteria bacterium GW2011_GWA1_47_20]KKU84002.1 MAG: Pseudouridine synthase [Candidatus Amesbacteria bacterium GW2011_GWC2_47_8]
MRVIDKPAGWVVNRAQTVKEPTIQDWFSNKILNLKSEILNKSEVPNSKSKSLEFRDSSLEFFEKGGIVHRLDKDTSGVMVLAKSSEAYEKLKQQFLQRQTVKKYVALVHGEFKEREGVVSTPLERRGMKFFVGGDLSKTAITEWRVLHRVGPYTLVELTPHTGRTHQLRVHMRHLGHPIVSDPIYGDRKTWKKDLQICPRLFLHAKSLEITHPTTGERMTFTAELPEELEKVVH